MVNCAISTTQMCGVLNPDRDTDSYNKIPIITKIRYMANLPTVRLVAST